MQNNTGLTQKRRKTTLGFMGMITKTMQHDGGLENFCERSCEQTTNSDRIAKTYLQYITY